MLSELEQREIDEASGENARQEAVVPEALKIVQRYRGWVSDEGVADVAAYLGMTRDEVDSIATAYNVIFRRPVGRHVILLCNSVSCWIVDYPVIYAHLKDTLGIDFGQTTADGRFTLLPSVCLGACDHAPAMLIDRELFGDLTAGKVDEILKKYT